MRLTLDWTEDEPSDCGAPPGPPDGSTLSTDDDGNVVVIEMREIQIRMGFLQFHEFVEACNAWIFKGCYGTRDVNDPEHIPMEEHQRLRKFIRGMLDTGTVPRTSVGGAGQTVIPEDVLNAMKWELETTPMASWRTQEERIRLLLEDIKDLREQLATARRKKKA